MRGKAHGIREGEYPPNVTFTPTGKPVKPEMIDERLACVDLIRDYRLEQLNRGTYRLQVLPDSERDMRGLRGAALDALVDVYGIHGDFEIDIILEDNVLMPKMTGLDRITRSVGWVHLKERSDGTNPANPPRRL